MSTHAGIVDLTCILIPRVQLKKDVKKIHRLARGRELNPRKLPKGWRLCPVCEVIYNINLPRCNCG